MKAVCSLEELLGLMVRAACCRCLRMNMGCRVWPGKKPNCVSGIVLFDMHQVVRRERATFAYSLYIVPLTAGMR